MGRVVMPGFVLTPDEALEAMGVIAGELRDTREPVDVSLYWDGASRCRLAIHSLPGGISRRLALKGYNVNVTDSASCDFPGFISPLLQDKTPKGRWTA